MANEITIVVKGRNEAGPAMASAKRDADQLSASGKNTDKVLVGLMADFNRVGEGASRFGRGLATDGNMSKFLEERLGQLRDEARRLGEEFNRTGNIDVLKRLRDSQGQADVFNKLRAEMSKAMGDAERTGLQGGLKAGDAFKGGFLSGLGDVALAASPALGPMAVALVAELLADIGGAMEAGVGLGGVFAGSLIQLHGNPQVKAAATDFGRWMMSQLTEESASFAPQMESAFEMLKGDLGGPVRDLGKDFAYLAPYVRELTMYLGAAVEKFMPGFNRAVQSSGPILEELGKGMVYVADGANVMFDEISKGGKGEVEALDTLFRLLGQTLAAVGFIIRAGSDTWDGYVQVLHVVVDWIDRVLGKFTLFGPLFRLTHLKEHVDGIARSFDDSGPALEGWTTHVRHVGGDANLTAEDLQNLQGQINAVAVTADTLAASMVQKLFSATMSVDQATLHWHESLTSLSDTLDRNGLAIDKHTHLIADNTKQGEQNRAAIWAAVSANMAQYQANVAVGMSATDAAAAYDANTAALERQLRKAGYTSAQIDNLIGKYRNVPDTVNTEIATKGLTNAINDLADLIRLINGIPPYTHLTIEEDHRINRYYGGDAFPSGHASGGIWGGLTWVGERGAELVKLPQGSQVYSHGDSQRMAGSQGSSSGASGGGQMTVAFVGDLADDGSQLVQRWFRTGKIRLIDSTGQPVTVN